MACVALTCLVSTIELEFLEPTSRVRESLRDRAPIKSLVATLSSWKVILRKESSDALKDLEFQIRDFALKAEDNIEIQLSNFLLAKDTEHEEEASQELCQTLQEAAEIAAEISDKEELREREREMTCNALTSVISTLLGTLSFYDRSSNISFLANLSSFQAFLQKKKKSSGEDGGAFRDLEIQIRDFALEIEDDIVYGENTTGQTWNEDEKIATDLLKILTGEKESYVSDREMASAALTILIAKFKCYYLQIFPSVYVRDKATMIYFLANLYPLQVCLMQMKSNGDAAIKIRNFALKAVNDIEIQLQTFVLVKPAERERKASRRLFQTLQEAAEIAAKLLKIIHKEEQHERKRVITCGIQSTLLEHSSLQVFLRLNTFMTKFYYDFLHSTPIVPLDHEAAMISFFQNLSSLQDYLLQESSGDGATINAFETEIRYFVIKVGDEVETQVQNLVQAKHDAEYQEQASQLNQTLQEAAETVEELLMSINSEKECKTEIEIACVALSSLMGTIEEFLYAEVATKSFLKSPHDKAGIKSNLLGKLSSLQVFLQKESNGGGATMKYLETKIKGFTLKAKDDIKIQLYNFLQAKDTEYEEKVSQELYHTMQEAAESAAGLLKIINSRSNEVDDANETQPSNTWLKHASRSANVESDGSSHGLLMPGGRMVGRQHDCRVIKDQLFSAEELKVISIVGMVGIGKTTVAKNVYEDPSVASRFDVRVWVTIPQDYDKSRMLSDLLQSIMPAERNVIKKRGTPDELEMQVRDCLDHWRYLIVLDNILSNQALTDIIQCLPDDFRGSCILLTTSYFNYNYKHKYIHNMTLLDPKESWELFCNVLSIEENLAPKFEQIRNHVVEKCDGLPQLIVEVAKRLSKCNNIQEGWKKIEKELESLGLLDRNALSVSYNMLPHHLKVCFLYFGVFPKRKKVLVKMLIRLWIAEGFVKPLKLKGLEDQAYEYLQELFDRSLLLTEDRSCNGKIKTCRMHSALHSFCVGEAQKGGILCAVNTHQHSGLSLKSFTNSCRWLSSYSHSFDYYVLFGTNIPRSIFFFLENPEMFVPPKLLRVLAFDTSISLQRVPVQLGGLVFLRYLSITQWFKDLDDVVSNNPNLETLVVSGNGAPTIRLPSNIWKPPQLKHLELGNSYMVYPPSADKKELKTLSWVVRPVHCRKMMYSKFPNIKNLKILLKDDIEPPSHIGGCCSNPIILDHFDYFKWLEKLSISVSIGCNAALPEQCRYPLGLKKLKLNGTNISEGDLNVIAKLPQLKVLKLEHAFHGTIWKVADGGFPELIFLLLEAKELKQWVVSSQFGFFKFRHLVLRSCNCLERMPENFIGYGLESIEFEGCHSSLVASAKQFQQKRRLKNLKIKVLDPKYDESQNTHTEVSSNLLRHHYEYTYRSW